MSLLLIIVICVVLFGGGFWGYSRWNGPATPGQPAQGWSGGPVFGAGVGSVLLIIVLLVLFGGLR